MDYDLEYVEKTGLSADYRQNLARYFGSLPEQARIHAFRMWLDAVGTSVPQAEEAYGCFLTTLHILKRSESRHGEHEELGTRLILSCHLNTTYDPLEAGESGNPLMVAFQCCQGFHERVFNGSYTAENAVRKPLLLAASKAPSHPAMI